MVYFTMDTIPAKITPKLVQELDGLISEGWYANRSEAIRDAVRELIQKHHEKLTIKAIEDDIAWAKKKRS